MSGISAIAAVSTLSRKNVHEYLESQVRARFKQLHLGSYGRHYMYSRWPNVWGLTRGDAVGLPLCSRFTVGRSLPAHRGVITH